MYEYNRPGKLFENWMQKIMHLISLLAFMKVVGWGMSLEPVQFRSSTREPAHAADAWIGRRRTCLCEPRHTRSSHLWCIAHFFVLAFSVLGAWFANAWGMMWEGTAPLLVLASAVASTWEQASIGSCKTNLALRKHWGEEQWCGGKLWWRQQSGVPRSFAPKKCSR